MITTEGKNHIRRYLAGYVPAIAQSMSFGAGTRAEAVTDIALQLESANAPIGLTNYDFVGNVLVYKASVPDEFVGKIHEIGVYSLATDPAAGEFASRTLTTFDSATESWVTSANADATFSATSTRIGADSMFMGVAVSSSATNSLKGISADLSGYSSSDSFTFAFNTANANTTQVRYRFMTDASNYYDFSLGAQAMGYRVVEVTKGSAVTTGSPNWGSINEIQITVTSGSGGASNVEFEAIRVEDKDALSLDYILVARKVLATPVTKIAGQPLDVEFTLGVTIT